MYEENLLPNKDPRKCAQIIGQVLRYYHQHSDSAAYKALVYLGQPWRHNVTLVDTDTNFGSAENPDGFAHYRYTEAKLSEFAYDCFFADWKFDKAENDMVVDWIPNYDDSRLEPMYLPSKYPLFLLNWHRALCPRYNNLVKSFRNCGKERLGLYLYLLFKYGYLRALTTKYK
jgi:DNA gyrase subunit A